MLAPITDRLPVDKLPWKKLEYSPDVSISSIDDVHEFEVTLQYKCEDKLMVGDDYDLWSGEGNFDVLNQLDTLDKSDDAFGAVTCAVSGATYTSGSPVQQTTDVITAQSSSNTTQSGNIDAEGRTAAVSSHTGVGGLDFLSTLEPAAAPPTYSYTSSHCDSQVFQDATLPDQEARNEACQPIQEFDDLLQGNESHRQVTLADATPPRSSVSSDVSSFSTCEPRADHRHFTGRSRGFSCSELTKAGCQQARSLQTPEIATGNYIYVRKFSIA